MAFVGFLVSAIITSLLINAVSATFANAAKKPPGEGEEDDDEEENDEAP